MAPATLQEWIDATARASPDRIAVTSSERSISYRVLCRAARASARQLQRHGARADALVALYTNRSVETIIGVVSVLFAGAAYLPLDAKLSTAELQGLVKTAQPVAAVVTQPQLEAFARVFGDLSLAHVCPSAADEASEPDEADALPVAGAPEHAAYALFTSG